MNIRTRYIHWAEIAGLWWVGQCERNVHFGPFCLLQSYKSGAVLPAEGALCDLATEPYIGIVIEDATMPKT